MLLPFQLEPALFTSASKIDVPTTGSPTAGLTATVATNCGDHSPREYQLVSNARPQVLRRKRVGIREHDLSGALSIGRFVVSRRHFCGNRLVANLIFCANGFSNALNKLKSLSVPGGHRRHPCQH